MSEDTPKTKTKTKTTSKLDPDEPRIDREYTRPTTWLSPRDAVTIGNPHALVPGTLYDAANLARHLAKSQAVGELQGRDADLMFRIVQGSELGLGPCASIRHIYTVQGRVGVEAVVLQALARGSDRCALLRQIETAHADHLASTWLVVRADDPGWAYVARWSIGDRTPPWRPDERAVRQWPNLREFEERGFVGVRADHRKVHVKGGQIRHCDKPNWKGNEPMMLAKRASSDVIRLALPDVVLGVTATEALRDDFGHGATVIDVEDADMLMHTIEPLADVMQHEPETIMTGDEP